MERDWDVIREVLAEVEALDVGADRNQGYDLDPSKPYIEQTKAYHAFMLKDAGFITGVSAERMRKKGLRSPELTWRGRELLDTLRSRPVWEKIKQLAQEKGLSLTLDTVMVLGGVALKKIVEGG